jgi:hypothetical protein
MGENGRLHEIAAEAVGMAFAAGDNGGARVGRFPWITVIADRTGKSETLADASLSVVKTEVDEEDRMTCESHNPVAIASVTTVTFHSVQGVDHSVAGESRFEFDLGAGRASSDASYGIV